MNQDTMNVLLTCLSYTSEAVKAERLAHVSAEEWQAVVKLARQHGVAQIVYHRLKQLDIALQGELADELKQVYLENVVRNMHLYQDLGVLLRRLHEEDILVIALKGAHLAELVYDNIGLRRMGDIDLLVRKNDLLRVEQELLALGYIPDNFNRITTEYNKDFSYTLPKKYINLELHWSLVDSFYPFRLDIEPLWNRAQPVILAQAPALVLSLTDLLLYLCFHTAIHTYDMQVKMLCDIGEIVQRYEADLDWLEIATRARQWGTLHSVYVILRLAQELLEAAVPAERLASLRPEGFKEHYLNLVRENIFANRADANMGHTFEVIRLWGPLGLGNKLALIRERLLPSREIMALTYPAPANSWRIYLYYPARIQYVLREHGATLWQLIRGNPSTRAAAERINEITSLRDWLLSG